MIKNMGTVDRGLRAVVGVVALVVAFTTLNALGGSIAGIVVAVVGAVMLLTASVSFCPAYLPLGLSTCKRP